jgi:hypothetical protein
MLQRHAPKSSSYGFIRCEGSGLSHLHGIRIHPDNAGNFRHISLSLAHDWDLASAAQKLFLCAYIQKPVRVFRILAAGLFYVIYEKDSIHVHRIVGREARLKDHRSIYSSASIGNCVKRGC